MPPRRPPRRIPSLPLEDLACAALFAFFSMQGSIPGIAPTAALEMTASAPTGLNTIGGIVSQALANLLILFLILRCPRLLLHSIRKVPWVELLALLAIASTVWSIDPALTLRRSVPFALAGLFGLYFATRFPAPRQFAILRLAMVAVALATTPTGKASSPRRTPADASWSSPPPSSSLARASPPRGSPACCFSSLSLS
jgi:hypothetical protein